jgi:hypothetical protein
MTPSQLVDDCGGFGFLLDLLRHSGICRLRPKPKSFYWAGSAGTRPVRLLLGKTQVQTLALAYCVEGHFLEIIDIDLKQVPSILKTQPYVLSNQI